MPPELERLLACPIDRAALARDGDGWLACAHGHRYPIIDGVPVLLSGQGVATMGVLDVSLRRARGEIAGDARAPELFLETLGLTDAERDAIVGLRDAGKTAIDPAVQYLVSATCGIGYAQALGRLERYPIPTLPLPPSNGEVLVDIGCNWGRWSFAAQRLGYRVIGIDPQLGAVMAAQRVARQIGSDASFVCADARYLPLATGGAGAVFSYSVLQHFSDADCLTAVKEIGRVLRGGGVAMVQMANTLGVRSLYHQARRGFRPPESFDVRYRMPGELLRLFEENVGPAQLSADCYLGLGLQASDADLVSPLARLATRVSEAAKAISRAIAPFARLADSVYIHATKP